MEQLENYFYLSVTGVIGLLIAVTIWNIGKDVIEERRKEKG